MQFPEKTIQMKDGRTAVLAAPRIEDAAEILSQLEQTCAETPYLLREAGERKITLEQEEAFLQRKLDSESECFLVCKVDGKVAGNSSLSFHTPRKTCHRASVAIALGKAYWGQGIGTAMFEEMIRIAREHGKRQLELTFVEGNDRGLALYRKMGFEIVAEIPDAFRLGENDFRKEYHMIKYL